MRLGMRKGPRYKFPAVMSPNRLNCGRSKPCDRSCVLALPLQYLGWPSNGLYLPEQDEISSVAFWTRRNRTRHFRNWP